MYCFNLILDLFTVIQCDGSVGFTHLYLNLFPPEAFIVAEHLPVTVGQPFLSGMALIEGELRSPDCLVDY